MNAYFARGKLLLSAEYLVLHGCRALAVPLRLGQSLEKIASPDRHVFSWNAFCGQKKWFSARMDPASLKIIGTSHHDKAVRLQEMIRACIDLMPGFQKELFRWDAATRLDFSPEYGLGSSSTLTALLAEWAEVNPLALHFMVSEGSGYDVACALASGPILYQLKEQSPRYRHVPFRPPFRHQLYFAWLGRKQETAAHLREIAAGLKPGHKSVSFFNQLTMKMIESRTLEEFSEHMEIHEEALSKLIGIERISSRFEGLPGTVKSLGAWGGDFILIASGAEEKELKNYLGRKEISVIYWYKDIVYEGEELQPEA